MSDSLFDVTFSVLNKALDGSSLRQKTIANNVANVNTPGYKSQSVSFEDQLKRAVTGDTESGGHSMQELIDEVEPSIAFDQSTSYRYDQNNVDIDGEMSKLAENQLYFAALSRLMEKKFRILQLTISEGRR